MPRKAVGRQPPQKGPAWNAFVAYWKHAIDGKQSRAIAWRAFHAGWAAQPARPEGLQATCGVPEGLPAVAVPSHAAGSAGRAGRHGRDATAPDGCRAGPCRAPRKSADEIDARVLYDPPRPRSSAG